MIFASYYLLVISLGYLLPGALTDPNTPYNACPGIFQYVPAIYEGYFVGSIHLPNVTMGKTVLEVQFSQQTPLDSDAGSGKLSIEGDQESTNYKIQNGLPLKYRVEFPNPYVKPKLTKITVNGRTICSANEYPGDSITIRMRNTLQTTMQRIVSIEPRVQQQSMTLPSITQSTRSQQPRPQTLQSICGYEGTSSELVHYIHQGTDLRRGQFPWLATICSKTTENGKTAFKLICGGSLISSRTIVTAAHCIVMSHLTLATTGVFLGRHNLSDGNEENHISHNVVSLKYHAEYERKSPDADVALMILAVAVSFTNLIRPICLWTGSDDANLIVNHVAVVAGWGGDENGRMRTVLPKQAQAKIVSENECRRSSEGHNKIITSRTLCAGQLDGAGPCYGDSGGGLLLKRSGRWTLRGVVSLGFPNCDLFNNYVLYTDVAKHKSWVLENMLQ